MISAKGHNTLSALRRTYPDLGRFSETCVMLIQLQVGQIQQKQQLDNLKANVERVVGRRRRLGPPDDGQRARVQHSVEQDRLRRQQQADQQRQPAKLP